MNTPKISSDIYRSKGGSYGISDALFLSDADINYINNALCTIQGAGSVQAESLIALMEFHRRFRAQDIAAILDRSRDQSRS